MISKRKMDIEAVLRWAYRDELCKRGNAAASGRNAWDSILRYGSAGGHRIDEGWAEPGHPPALGDPHPDALLVEQAVRGLTGISGELDPTPLLFGLEGFGLDAVAITASAVRNLPNSVAVFARLGSRPHEPDLPTFIPLEDRGKYVVKVKGIQDMPARWEQRCDKRAGPYLVATEFVQIEVERTTKARRKDDYPDGSYCTLVWDSPRGVLVERAEYAAWWAALDFLAEDLVLHTIDVTPLRAPQSPWLGEVEALQAVHVDPASARKIRQKRVEAVAQRLFDEWDAKQVRRKAREEERTSA